MTVAAATLRELHRIHQQLADLRERLDRGPKQIRARAANVAQLEQALRETQDRLKATKIQVDQKQLLLKSGENKIADLQAKLNAAKSNREYQALVDQIAADQMAISVLQDEILEALEKIDQQQVLVGQAQENLKKGQQELATTEQAVHDREESLKADITRLEAELVTSERSLPGDIREAYDRVVRSKGSDALGAVEDGQYCGGCHQQMPPNMVNDLFLSKPVFCRSCGRLIYLPEDRRAG